MEANQSNPKESFISKKALVTFVSGATIVFLLGIYYCVSTGHVPEAGILTGALVVIGIFAASLYKSFSKEK